MNNIFLASYSLSDYPLGGSDTSVLDASNASFISGIAGSMMGIIIAMILVSFALYIYISFAYSKIGDKAKLGTSGIAWMPSVGPLIIAFETSKMHWWPFLMVTIGTTLGLLIMMTGIGGGQGILILGSVILYATLLAFGIMTIVWHWKTYESIGKPGWWILIPIISGALYILLFVLGAALGSLLLPILGIILMIGGMIAHLVLIGIAAWSKE